MKYEINIEGLPEGLVPERFVIRGLTAGAIKNTYMLVASAILRRKVRKYDWSKTLDDVLINSNNSVGIFQKSSFSEVQILRICPVWQPNIHGKCPVDPEACIVRVRQCDGEDYEDLGSNFNWDVDIVYRWQFIRLADGVEW